MTIDLENILDNISMKEDVTKIVQAFVRAGNIAQKAENSNVSEALLTAAEEKALYQAYTSAASAMESLVEEGDYTGALDALQDLAAPIDAFFDAVMVMDKDEQVKNNRLGLMLAITELLNKAADFSKIVFA